MWYRCMGHCRLILVMLVAVVGLSLVTPSPAAAYNWPPVLKRGARSPAVKELQIRIAGWAADHPTKTYLAIDSVFGLGTEKALKRFQHAYGLPMTGVVDQPTQKVLNSLEDRDGSTAHFNWSEFYSHGSSGFSGGKVASATVRENIRRLMYKLEALRKKAGDRPVTVVSGFRSVQHNNVAGGKPNSQHMYGIAADIVVTGLSKNQTFGLATTSGFSGIFLYGNTNHTHVDSRMEYPYGARFYCWDHNADSHCD